MRSSDLPAFQHFWTLFLQEGVFTAVFEKVLIYVGPLFLVLGIIITIKKKELRFVHYWLLAIIIFFFIGAYKVVAHTYYTIPIVAPASILIGYAISNSLKLITAYRIAGGKESCFNGTVYNIDYVSSHYKLS